MLHCKSFLKKESVGMKYIADRIENGFAVLVNMDDDSVVNVPADVLDGVKEGDVFLYDTGKYICIENETELREKSLAERFNRLKSK